MITPEQFTDELKKVLGPRLASVIVYGSAAHGDETKPRSNVNLLLVVDRVDLALLKSIQPIIKKWRNEKQPTPLLFSEETLKNSADIFPLEFLDIQAARRVLFGADLFQSLDINLAHLRHQVEFELRSKLLLLRQKFFEIEGDAAQMKLFLGQAMASFTALMKGVLWIKGVTPPAAREEIWALVNENVSIDGEGLKQILNIREGKAEAKGYDLDDLFNRLHESMVKVTRWVDEL